MTRRHSFFLLGGLLLGAATCRIGQAEESLSEENKQRILAAYHALPEDAMTKQKIAALPTGQQFVKLDVSTRIRSASFGHTTTVLVPSGAAGKPADPNRASEFYVEYGRSTNAPGGTFGPFKLR